MFKALGLNPSWTGSGRVAMSLVFALLLALALGSTAWADDDCDCEGGIVLIELRTGLPYSGGTISVEARAARRPDSSRSRCTENSGVSSRQRRIPYGGARPGGQSEL